MHDLLDMAQVKAGTFSLNIESFNFRETIKEIIQLMSVQTEPKGIEIIEDVDSSIPIEIDSDSCRLR